MAINGWMVDRHKLAVESAKLKQIERHGNNDWNRGSSRHDEWLKDYDEFILSHPTYESMEQYWRKS